MLYLFLIIAWRSHFSLSAFTKTHLAVILTPVTEQRRSSPVGICVIKTVTSPAILAVWNELVFIYYMS